MTRHIKKLDRLVWLLPFLLGACATAPASYTLRGEGAPQLNPDASGKPLSVVVKVYQLKQATEFSKLTFDVMAAGRPESELLGADLIEKSEHVVVPGGTFAATQKLAEDTAFIGIVALFRQPDVHLWRQLVAADKIRDKDLTFTLRDCYIIVAPITPEPIPGRPESHAPRCGVPGDESGIPVPTGWRTFPSSASAPEPATRQTRSRFLQAADTGKQILPAPPAASESTARSRPGVTVQLPPAR